MPPVLAHDRTGAGEALILVHGLGDRRQTWTPVVDRLAAQREVVTVDLPGFGDSSPLPAGRQSDVAGLAAAVSRFAEELGLERPHVAGNSLGGAIALELGRTGRAATATALSPAGFQEGWERGFSTRSLQLTATLARRARPPLHALAATGPGRTLVAGQMYARPWRVPAAELRAALVALAAAPGFDATLTALGGWSWTHGDIDVPATIAWGTHDRLLLHRQAARALRRMPRARHVDLTGCGHVPMWDDPGLVADVLLGGSTSSLRC